MRVALIGGGPTAATVMESLLHARAVADSTSSLHVTVFDPAAHQWCGPNYAPDMPEALTNSPPSIMSLRHWDDTHFSDWLAVNGYGESAAGAFVPRAEFGRYVRDSAERAATCLDSVDRVCEQVTRIRPADDYVDLATPTASYRFDYAVACVGGATSADPYRLAGQEGFSVTPYPLEDTLPSVDRDEHVGIIGSGLTAVDIVLGLEALGHRGPITVMSRGGWLPSVRRPEVNYDLRYFTVDRLEELVAAKGAVTLSDLIDLTHRELAHAGARPQPLLDEILATDYGVGRLRRQMMMADDGEIACQIGFKMLATAYEDAWYLLGNREKAHLYGRYRQVAHNLCCPIPRHRAEQMLDLADAGRLEVVRGLHGVAKARHRGFIATAAGMAPVHCDRVVSALSGVEGMSPLAKPIINSLVRSGCARLHRFGGLDVERRTSRIIDADGRPQPRLYALGGAVRGALYIFNAIILIARRSSHVADSIIRGDSRRLAERSVARRTITA